MLELNKRHARPYKVMGPVTEGNMVLRRLLPASAALAAALVLASASPAGADVVHLRNGSSIEGVAIETSDGWEVRLKLGVITLKRDEVLSVDRQKTADELYQERLSRLDLADPEAVLRFARWCADHGLVQQAEELRSIGRGAMLERRVSEVGPGDARGFYELAMWASAEGYSRDVYRYLLEKAVESDPAHPGARRALGQSVYEGQWRSDEEIARLKEEAYDQRMAEKGLVKLNGKWMTPDAAAFERERAELDRRRAELDAEAARIERERLELEKFKRELEDFRAGLEALQRALAEERARLEELAREIERREQGQGYRRSRETYGSGGGYGYGAWYGEVITYPGVVVVPGRPCPPVTQPCPPVVNPRPPVVRPPTVKPRPPVSRPVNPRPPATIHPYPSTPGPTVKPRFGR